MARFGEGNTNGTGRPKGSRNKLNTDIKEAFDIAFKGIGGTKALTDWASSDVYNNQLIIKIKGKNDTKPQLLKPEEKSYFHQII